MQRTKYAPEFKDEAVKQVVVRGHSVVDVAKRLGIPENVLYTWVSKFKKADEPLSNDLKVLQAEMVKLKAELRRTTEERDILKKVALDSTRRCNTFDTSVQRGADSWLDWDVPDYREHSDASYGNDGRPGIQ